MQRRQHAHEHVVQAAVLARLLDHHHVLRLLDDADHALIARWTYTEYTGIGGGDVVTRRAVGHLLLDVPDRLAQPLGVVAWILEQVERKALRTFGADAGELLELLDQP